MSKTKNELANSLRQLTYEKPFNQISISDITSKCDLNRQTFYYHFQDIFECLEWIYRNDCLKPLLEGMDINNWDKKIVDMLMIISNDIEFYRRSIYAAPRTFIDLFFNTTKNIFREMIQNIEPEIRVDEKDEDFYSEFLTMGIMGMIMNWVTKGMNVSPLELSDRIKNMASDIRILRELKLEHKRKSGV